MLIPPYNATPICRYISEILPIQRKALNNQSINQCHPRISPSATGFKKDLVKNIRYSLDNNAKINTYCLDHRGP